MSDLILNLSHYHRHNDLCSADNRHDVRPYVSCTGFAFYIAVRCGFVKHFYLTSCLNAHNHNTCTRLPQTGCAARKPALLIISQDCQTQVLAANAMATTIIIDYNSRFPWSLSPAKWSTVFVCNNPSDNIAELRYLGTVRLLRPKTKQSPIN